MAEREQSYKSHRRYFPWHHFVVQPLLFANFIAQIVRLVNDQSKWNVWQVVLATALVIFSFTSRSMSLRAQDRVIRLEERMRQGPEATQARAVACEAQGRKARRSGTGRTAGSARAAGTGRSAGTRWRCRVGA